MEAILSGHPMQSLYYNPVVIMMIILAVCVLIIKMVEKKRKKQKLYKARIITYVSFFVLWFLFFAVRNVLLVRYGIDTLGDFGKAM